MGNCQVFNINAESAKKADGGGRIETTGKYVGVFKHAEFVTAKSGAQGIELWQSAVMNFGNNTINFYSEYISDVKLYVQNESGADVYGIILYECFPISIGMLDMSYASTNMPLNIQIMLSFKSWIPMSNSNADNFNRTI